MDGGAGAPHYGIRPQLNLCVSLPYTLTRSDPSVQIPADRAREIALADACEDYCGLYELIWDLNSQFPESAEQTRLAAAQQALAQLAAQGLVTLYHTRWLSSEYEPLSAEHAARVLTDPSAWRPPSETPDASYYCFASTSAGEAAYYRQPAD